MLQAEIDWLERHFADLREGVHSRIDAIEAEAREHRALALRHLNAITFVVHHLFTRGTTMDHATLRDLATKAETDILAAADAAVAEFKAFEATHTATVEALDDVGAIVSGLPGKVADKLAAIKAPADAPATPDQTSGTSVSVVAPVTPASVTIPVESTTGIETGATVDHPSIPDGATVTAVIDNHPATGGPAITIDASTTAPIAAGDVVTVTPPAAPAS